MLQFTYQTPFRPLKKTLYKSYFPEASGHKKKSVGLSQADALTNHIINNTKTNNQ